MTAIVAHRDGWMVADLACRANLWVIPVAENKIVRFGEHSLVAAAGLSGFRQESEEIQKEHSAHRLNMPGPKELIKSLCAFMLTHSTRKDDDQRQLLMVTKDRQLIGINQMGIVDRYSDDEQYWCSGSGDELCLGFLAGLQHKHPERHIGICAQDAVEAIRFASKYQLGVSYASTTEHL